MPHKTLPDLFIDFPFKYVPVELPALRINGISLDSRAVKPGHLFVAMRGGSVDGHDFIPKALANGAVAVVGQKIMEGLPAPYILVDDSRRALTWLAAAFYDWPGRNLTVIGVTGTDGKTTTSNLLFQIMKASGLNAGIISTVNAVIGDEVLDTGFHVTTPDAPDVQRYLAQMIASGLTHVVLETTSHGWAQHRVDACEFDIGVVTNITHEHLDEHGSYENYRSAKARLFSSLAWTRPKPGGNPRLAVLNRDDASFEYLDGFAAGSKVSYGLSEAADVHARQVSYSLRGMSFDAYHPKFRVAINCNLLGLYNVSNCLAALAAATFGLGIAPEVAARGIATLPGIPGRMEVIDMGQPFKVIVDFAHTPNALKVSLEAARALLSAGTTRPGSKGRIIAVFGSAGLRDKEKRRMMAVTSADLADLTVLTAEDPRTESLSGILEEMAAGARGRGGREGVTFWRVPDRGEALRFALGLARPDDLIIACGKGHEQSMCFGRVEHPWDDRLAVRAALAEFLGVVGPAMPYLPTQDTPEEEWLEA